MPRKRTSKNANLLLSPYGICLVCDAEVQFPGLDGYKCSQCGWLKLTEISLILKKRAAQIKAKHKDLTRAAANLSPVENLEIVALNSA